MKLRIVLSLMLAASCALAQDAEWKDLIGKDFTGWKQLGGKAKYEIKDGVVIGTSVPNTPNSFLTTEKHYGDFHLEYEFKIAEQLNSGVQIRSNSLPEYRNGRVHGYQVEIDPDVDRARLWTAGIYDEGRRGWINDLSENEAARKAFKANDWNKIRVEAVGDSIKTWLNGVAAADLVDAMTQKGFIGLQVHGVGKPEQVGLQVMWRNIRVKDLGEHGWKPIFDGKTLAGWEPLPGGTWEVADGAIVGKSPKAEARHGILLSKEQYKDFTVRCQFKVTSGDSGFYFRSEKVPGGVSVHGFQAEVDETDETGGLYETGGRGWVVKPEYEGKAKSPYKPQEWNTLSVSAHGNRVVVHINNRKTAELLNDEKGRKAGHIGLQLHGGQDMHVEYKDIEVLVANQGEVPRGAAESTGPKRVYFGTGGRESKGIYTAMFDGKSGKLSKTELAAEIRGPGFLAWHPDGTKLYAVARVEGGSGVAGYQCKDDGSLEPINTSVIGDGGAAHIAVHPSGKFLLTAQYGGGSTAFFPIDDEGRLGKSVVHEHEGGSKVVGKRQDSPHPHWCGFSPDGKFAFVPDLGTDNIHIYKVDTEAPSISKHGLAASVPGGGPRHMRFSIDGKFIYLLNELALSVTTFEYDAAGGRAEAVSTTKSLSDSVKAKEGFNSASEILVHPNGTFVYSANRGHDSVTAFRADVATGKLTAIEVEPIRGAWPRNINLDPSGKWLLAAGARSNTVSVFAIDQETGELKFQQGSIVGVPGPICILFED